MLNGHFSNKVVIITGASSGIGAELARNLAKQKAKLVLAARNIDNLKTVAEECSRFGAETTLLKTDVSNQSDCEMLIKHAADTFGRIDVLVNNAGMGMWTLFEELSDISVVKRIMDINYLGSVYCTHYALKYLKASKGQIVVVSSESGKTGVPTRSGYAATKHAVNGFFDSLRIELMGSGVSITSIYPGFISTGLHERNFGADGKQLGKNHGVDYSKAMTTEKCVEILLDGMAKRKRDVFVSSRIKVAMWLKLIAPNFVDKMAYKVIKKG